MKFEQQFTALEQIVEKLETGECTLDESIKLFQDGINLSKSLHETLQNVEKQVEVLTMENGSLQTKEIDIKES
jgi:exodeoxyribonuclease VII small subunit